MPNQLFEMTSPFDEPEALAFEREIPTQDDLDLLSAEINARRATLESAEHLRRARAL